MNDTTGDARAAARKRLEERRGFVPPLVVFIAVNAGLILTRADTGAHEVERNERPARVGDDHG